MNSLVRTSWDSVDPGQFDLADTLRVAIRQCWDGSPNGHPMICSTRSDVSQMADIASALTTRRGGRFFAFLHAWREKPLADRMFRHFGRARAFFQIDSVPKILERQTL